MAKKMVVTLPTTQEPAGTMGNNPRVIVSPVEPTLLIVSDPEPAPAPAPQAPAMTDEFSPAEQALLMALLAKSARSASAAQAVAETAKVNAQRALNQQYIAIVRKAIADTDAEIVALTAHIGVLDQRLDVYAETMADLRDGKQVVLPAFLANKKPGEARAKKDRATGTRTGTKHHCTSDCGHVGYVCGNGYVIKVGDDFDNISYKNGFAYLCKPAALAAGFKNLAEFEKNMPEAAQAAKVAVPRWAPSA